MSSEREECSAAEVLVGLKAAALLSSHHIHKIRGEDKWCPLSLEALWVWPKVGCGFSVCVCVRVL